MSDTNPTEDFTELNTDAILNEEQTARAAALTFARAILADESKVLGSNTSLPKRFGTTDLIDLAQWIIDERDPMATYYEEERRRAES